MNIAERARAILTEPSGSESTGLRKSRTPILERMGALVRLGGLGSVVLLSACSPAMMQGGPDFGGRGYAQGFQQPQGVYAQQLPQGYYDARAQDPRFRDPRGYARQPEPGVVYAERDVRGDGSFVERSLGVGHVQVGRGTMRGGFPISAQERQMMHQVERRAYEAPLGQAVTWRNPQTGNGTTVVPVRQGFTRDGLPCRDFEMTVYEAGTVRQGRASACRTPSGWRTVVGDAGIPGAVYADAGAEPAPPRMG